MIYSNLIWWLLSVCILFIIVVLLYNRDRKNHESFNSYRAWLDWKRWQEEKNNE